jgi:DNA excision repair protein ERCC-2
VACGQGRPARLRDDGKVIPATDANPEFTVAVRELCEFAAKTGDLDLRFTPSPTAQEGIAGHQQVVARRDAGYRAELAVQGTCLGLQLRGRVDGWDATAHRLEEIKTHKGDLALQPANHRALHWAQAQVYGALLCQQLGLAHITLALVYFELGSQAETVLQQGFDAAQLQAILERLCSRYLGWARQQAAHRQARDAALGQLAFPHASFRTGQRELARQVFTAARLGRCLMAQAPTGIGKTLATIFPLLKASPGQRLDKLFCLSAKGPGRGLALAALQTLREGFAVTPLPNDESPALPLRVLELIARDKACEHPGKACHGQSCPLAQGFYDKLPAARQAACSTPNLNTTTLRQTALAHQVCPYYLSQELVRWSDVVVGDYNHWFDISALLHSLTVANGWRVAVLVDEAHNLVERARAMASATLSQADLRPLRQSAPAALKRPLDRLHRAFLAASKGQTAPYQVLPALPTALISAAQEAASAITDWQADQAVAVDGDLLRYAFDAGHLARLAERFDASHSIVDLQLLPRRGASRRAPAQLCLRNVVPAPFLQPRLAAAHCTVMFSATLTPPTFYADLLGLPDDTAWLTVESPFAAEQLQVRVCSAVSTRWQHRAASVAPIVDLMATQFAQQPGNYLAFFSSFDYLAQVAGALQQQHPGLPQWQQTRAMDDAQREAFLARFEPGGQGIGFAVLGGLFAEGIDLPGSRLIGAFIATLGLPQLNDVNEAMKRQLQQRFGTRTGHDYAYLYPGLRKVVQAAGRVIRTPQDRGVVHLIDDRFAQAKVRGLLPAWWGLS